MAEGYIPRITDLLKDTDGNVRRAAIRALGNLSDGGKVSTGDIANLLKDGEAGVRGIAAEALGKMGDMGKEYIPEIGRLLSDKNADVRAMSAGALSDLNADAKDLAPKLTELLSDKNTNVSDNSLKALEKQAPVDMPTILQILAPVYFQRERTHKQRFCAHYLGGGIEKNEILVKWLGNPKESPDINKLNREELEKAAQVLREAKTIAEERDRTNTPKENDGKESGRNGDSMSEGEKRCLSGIREDISEKLEMIESGINKVSGEVIEVK